MLILCKDVSMKILYDLSATQIINGSKYNGGAEYSKTIFYAIMKNNYKNIDVFYYKNYHLDDDLKLIIKEYRIRYFEIVKIKELENILSSGEYTKFFSGNGYGYSGITFLSNVQVLTTIHGLRFIELPVDIYEMYFLRSIKNLLKWLFRLIFSKYYINMKKKQMEKYFENIVKSYNKIVTDSNHSKYSIINNIPNISKENILVLYPPNKNVEYFYRQIERKNNIIMISCDRWEKNPIRALYALDAFFDNYDSLYKKFYATIIGEVPTYIKNKIRNKNNFQFLNYVDKNHLEQLYATAFCLLYPSLNEGFGYPPLEAMKYGTLVICSAVASLTEVYGDSVFYINPYSVNEITTRLIQITNIDYEKYSKNALKKYYEINTKQENDLQIIVEEILK